MFFLSRPRRFGKSLLLSTLEAYFEGKKELFAGLAIEQLEKDWKQYPVLHLDLNTQEYNSVDSLKEKLNIALTEWEKDCGVEPAEKSLATRFEGIIKRTSRKMGQRVVILIDEYDKPMLQAIGRPELQEAYRSLLKSFYGALKSADGYIRFAMLTGVTAPDTAGIYNPFSLLHTFKNREFGSYWFATGTPSYLVELLKRNHYDLDRLAHEEFDVEMFGGVESFDSDLFSAFYQNGYLTIKGYDPCFRISQLGFPNLEIEKGIAELL